MGKAGGARPNAGRKRGVLTTRAQEIVAKASEQGISPLEVMLHDMRYYYNLGEKEFDKIRGNEMQEASAETFKKAHSLKQIARECAIMAAPYIHPKLQSVDAKVSISNQENALLELE